MLHLFELQREIYGQVGGYVSGMSRAIEATAGTLLGVAAFELTR